MSRRSSTVIAIALLMVISPIVGVASIGSVAAQQGMAGVPGDNVGPPDHANGVGPTGNVGPPAHANIPTHAAAWDVRASDHAGDLHVAIGQKASGPGNGNNPNYDGPLALVLRDDVNHDGREVTVDASTLVDALGYRPDTAYGVHESGDQWTAEIDYTDGRATWTVPKFSSNTVTFAGETHLSATPADDGATMQYDAPDLDAVDNFTIDATGVENTQWDNESAAGVGLSSSQSLSVGGNLAPVAGDGGDPKLSVTADAPTGSYTVGNGDSGTTPALVGLDAEGSDIRLVPSYSGPIDTVTLPGFNGGTTFSADVGIYLAEEAPDTVSGEGTRIGTWDPDASDSGIINVSGSPEMTAGNTYSLSFSPDAAGDDDIRVNTESSSGTVWMALDGGQTYEKKPNVEVSVDRNVEGLSMSDGAGQSLSFGNMADGETITKRIDLSTSSTAIDWSGSGGGAIDYSLEMRERTETPDFGVEVNGNWANSTTGLSDGATTSLTTDTAWIQEGINRVNVSVGDGSLKADAPDPLVNIDYRHDTDLAQSVDYTKERFTVRYNVSREFATDLSGATMTIPFANNVYHLRDVETRRDGGTWSDASGSASIVNGNDAEIDVGDVSAGESVDVRVNGSRLKTSDMSIEVTDATISGDLDTRFKITSIGPDGSLSGWSSGANAYLPVTKNHTWEASPFVRVEADATRELRFPDAVAGDSARVEMTSVTAIPKTGDADISIRNDGRPFEFELGPGDQPDDAVEFTYYDTVSGEKYVLQSVSAGKQIDSATASSPVTLEIGDDSVQVLQIFQEETTASAGDGDPSTGGPIPGPQEHGLPTILVPIVASILSAAIVYTDQRWIPGSSWTSMVVVPAIWIVGAEMAGIGLISTLVDAVASNLDGVVQPVAFFLVLAGVYIVYKRYTGPENVIRVGNK